MNKTLEVKINMEKVKLLQGVTAYEDLNKEFLKVVVFLHGGTIPSWCYDHVFKKLQGKNFRLIRYDMYGRGESDSPNLKYNRITYLQQLENFLENLKINKVHAIVGCSFGASLGTLFSLKNPRAVKKIIYISPAINWVNNIKLARIFFIPILGRILFYTVGKKLIRKRALGFMKFLKDEEFLVYQTLIEKQFHINNHGFWDSLYKQLTTDALKSYLAEYKTLGGLNQHDVSLIWGIGDKEVSADDIKNIKQYFQNINIKNIKGAGHGLMAEFPELVAAFVVEALKEAP